jgi:hypothetical protein
MSESSGSGHVAPPAAPPAAAPPAPPLPTGTASASDVAALIAAPPAQSSRLSHQHEDPQNMISPDDTFTITMMELRQLMELRSAEGLQRVQDMGGVGKICQGVRSDPVKGQLHTLILLRSLGT